MWRASVFVWALAACSPFPELDETIDAATEAADFPELVPLEPILAEAAAGSNRDPQTKSNLDARAAALRSRAARLRTSVVDEESKARMQRGVPQG